MIKVHIQLDDAGTISRIRATGHSGAAAKGQDIVCASASVLLRTLARTLEPVDGIILNGSMDVEGEFFLDICLTDGELTSWLRGVSSSCMIGLSDLEAEYPEYCSVSITKS